MGIDSLVCYDDNEMDRIVQTYLFFATIFLITA